MEFGDDGGEPGYGRRLEESLERQRDPQLGAQARHQLGREQRVPAPLEEAVEDAHALDTQHRREEGVLGRFRDLLEEAVLKAEARAPVLASLLRRLLETLASIGL